MTHPACPLCHRRAFLRSAVAGSAAFFTSPGAFAERLETPGMTEGPFYPDKMPLDTDNDLVVIGDSLDPGVGEITHLSGQVFGRSGSPVRNALVEIWQCDANGAYLHSGSNNADRRDGNFQGYGRFLTDAQGRYYFRTIKPVSYPGRTPHIHVAVNRKGKRLLTSQILVNGHPQNARDGLLRRIDPEYRSLVMADFRPLEGSKAGELTAGFDIHLAHTPEG